MSEHLEDFIKNNREDFDRFEPGPVVWHNIQQELKKPAAKDNIVISMKTLRWSAAAAILLVLGAAAWYYTNGKKNDPSLAVTQAKAADHYRAADTPHPATANSFSRKQDSIQNLPETGNDPEYQETLYHYARLIALKQTEVKKIQLEEPLLYQQFAGDFRQLDSNYHILQQELPQNPNREQILEAMIQNLQYQEALLNQQLNIIKKINHAKKQTYEKTYRNA